MPAKTSRRWSRVWLRRTLDSADLAAFLRHELMHVVDMLDPAFCYAPDISLGGINEMEDHLIRERFRILWDIYIDSRLKKKGFSVLVSEEQLFKEFQEAFCFLGKEKQQSIFLKITHSDRLTQSDLIELAHNDNLEKSFNQGGRLCPLCNFPSYAHITDWRNEANLVAEEIKKEYPHWEVSLGICSQCFEMYRSRIKIAAPFKS